jgi:glycosyltransferase involved in cell wall biosynthesis
VIVEGNSTSMASAIRELLEHRDQRRAMGQNGRSWVFSFLEPDQVLGQYESLYRGAVRAHAARA